MATVTHSNCELYYERHGKVGAPALVFAHGAGGNALSWWQQIPEFRADHDIIVFDHRGFGRSPCAPEHYSMGLLGDDLAAILDAEGIDRATVVGQSMGGWTCTQLAAYAPERVSKVVLCNTPGAIMTDAIVDAFRKTAPIVAEGGLIAHAVAPQTHERDPALGYLYEQIAAMNPPRPDLNAGSSTIPAEDLARITAPVHMICSDLDTLFPAEALRSVADVLGARSFHVVAGCGHSTYFEKAAEFNALLRQILAD